MTEKGMVCATCSYWLVEGWDNGLNIPDGFRGCVNRQNIQINARTETVEAWDIVGMIVKKWLRPSTKMKGEKPGTIIAKENQVKAIKGCLDECAKNVSIKLKEDVPADERELCWWADDLVMHHYPAMGHCIAWDDSPWPSHNIPHKPGGKTVIVVGGGPTRPLWRRFAEENPGAEVWTMNNIIEEGATKHYQIHETMTPKCDTTMVTCPIVWREDYDFHQMPFPKYTSTVDYILADVVRGGFDNVYLPGIEYWGVREIGVQARGAEYFIGALMLRENPAYVWWSPLSHLMEERMYGHKDDEVYTISKIVQEKLDGESKIIR